MRTPSAQATCSLVLVASLASCSDPPPIELAGSYTGDARCNGETLRMNEDVDENGRGDGTTTQFRWNDDDIVLTFRRVDPTHLELDVNDCTLRFVHPAPPQDEHARVEPGQHCRIHEATFDHDVPIYRGWASFGRATGTVRLSLGTNADVGDLFRAGGESVEWSYEFSGARSTP
jgi:hypothetical protein